MTVLAPLCRLALALAALPPTLALGGCLDPDLPGNLVPATVDDDPSLARLELADTTLHVATFGDPADPVIIMLHGGPGFDHQMLLRLRQPVDGVRLEDDHFVVFWDQRGAGLSRRHAARELSLAAYDADLAALVDHYAPGRPVVLIGHSWGGMYAARFIGQHPERVAGAVLLEPGPLTGKLWEEKKDAIIQLDLFSEWLGDFTWAQQSLSPDSQARADYLLALGVFGDAQPAYHMAHADPFPFRRLGALAQARVQGDGFDDDGIATWDFTVGLAVFARPVLIEASRLDTAIGVAFQERQATFFADAELAIVEGAGHDHPWSAPEATLRPIFAYLGRIEF